MGGLTLLLAGFATIVLTAGRISNVSGFPIHEYALPAIELVPGPITIDRKNDVWFAQEAGTRIGELRADGTLHVYQVPGTGEQIQALAAADDGKVWFTQTLTYDGSRNRVGYIRQDGRVTLYRLPRKNAFVSAIASDASGGAWVSEFGARRVAHISGSGRIEEFSLPGPATEFVRSIDVDRHGAVWVLQDDAIVHLSSTGVMRRFVVQLPKSVEGIRNMVRAGTRSWWMTVYGTAGHDPEIWRFTTPDRLVRYRLLGSGLGPVILAAGAHGSAWMAYDGARIIAHIDRSGNVTQYTLPFDGNDVWGMTADDLGDVWFANAQSEKLGVFGSHTALEPHPIIGPLTVEESKIVEGWQSTLQPRSGYDMQHVTADTLSVDQNFAVVGWSDEGGNAATLMQRRAGRWALVFVTNGNFNRPQDLTAHGVPVGVATQLLRDSNVIVVPYHHNSN
ncbi:MAG: Vgb family protein [Vulcanimicrobiaceae bacterium]